MALSIYDILNKDIDYKKEHNKIRDLFLNYYWIKGSINCEHTYEEVFDAYIMQWKYRGSKCSLKEIINDIETKTHCGENPINDCLYLCELILNIREFLMYISKNYHLENLYISDFKDNMLIDTVEYIIKTLGYRKHKEDEYKIILVKENADSINTAIISNKIEVSNLIMQYNDFKIINNANEKRKILQELEMYLVPQRKKLKEINYKLEKNLFMAFNKLHIRHNNLEGKDKEEYTSKLTKEELLEWYDRTYNLILISIRLLELNNQIQPFEDIAKQYFENN